MVLRRHTIADALDSWLEGGTTSLSQTKLHTVSRAIGRGSTETWMQTPWDAECACWSAGDRRGPRRRPGWDWLGCALKREGGSCADAISGGFQPCRAVAWQFCWTPARLSFLSSFASWRSRECDSLVCFKFPSAPGRRPRMKPIRRVEGAPRGSSIVVT